MEQPGSPIIPIEEEFKKMADSAPAFIWIAGVDKLRYFFNAVWLNFTGRTMKQELGNGWTENVHPDDLQRYLDTYISSFDARKDFKIEYRLRRHDGKYRWMINNGVPRYNTDGTFAGYIGSCMDIDELLESERVKNEFIAAEVFENEKSLNEELAATNEELASSNEELNSINEELNQSKKSLADLNNKLEDRVIRRTKALEESEASLRNSRHRLKSMVMTTPIGMTILRGRDLVVEVANAKMLEIWNHSWKEVSNKPLLEIFPELADQPFPKLLLSVLDTGKPVKIAEIEVDIASPHGNRHIHVELSYDPLFDTEGNVEAIIATIIDITAVVEARKALEKSEAEQQALNEELTAINEEMASANEELMAINEELADTQENLKKLNSDLGASEARIRFLVEDAPVAIGLLVGPELIIESANRKMLELWGKTDIILDMPLHLALPELQELGQPFLKILDNVLTSGLPYYGNEAKIYLERNGKMEELYFNFVYHPVKDSNEIATSIMVVATEVTEQVRSRQLIEANEARFRFILNAIPQQVWTATPGGSLNYVNQVVCNDFGYSTEEIVGHGWQKFIHPDDLENCLTKWAAALSSGQEYVVEFRLMFHDGAYHWHLARAIPLIEDGKINLWLGTNTDINIQKNNEQRKDEFLSIASHELKTPLTSIKAYNQIIQRINDPEKLKPFINKSADHIIRLERLVSDLLDVTKINAGKMSYMMEPFNFSEMMADSIESIRHTALNHKVILENNADIIYIGDRYRMEQVMNNFLSNAIKYSPEDNKIIVTSKIDHDNIVVAVQDFGIGIARNNLDRLFERYYRVDNTAMRFEGLGLGLFISAEILRRHGGSFWIESEQGKGSTFYFRLPIDHTEKNPVVHTNTFYRDGHITINYNKTLSRLDTDWLGFQNMESVKNGCLMMLDILIKNNCKKIMNDNRHVLGTWAEASDWVREIFFPMMESAGIKYIAWIFALGAVSQFAAEKSIDTTDEKIKTLFFTDITAAEDWINELN